MIDWTWRFAFASVAGTSHLRIGAPCQDASECYVFHSLVGEPIMVGVVSDGAGTAECSADGARMACEFFVESIEGLLSHGGAVKDITPDWAHAWIRRFHVAVTSQAESIGLTSRAFACTIVAVVAGTDCAAVFHVGDGAVVAAEHCTPHEYKCISWPAKGEYANTTTFVTDPASLESISDWLIGGSGGTRASHRPT
jgi:hypothetical protein